MLINPSQEDQIITGFLQSIGPWNHHILIGGGYALIIYKLYLAHHEKGLHPVSTRDLDSLIPRKISRMPDSNISENLNQNGFTRVYKDYNDPATESYIKEIAEVEIEIEFLTDANARGGNHKNVKIAGIVAQPLRYLKVSIQSPKIFRTFSGEIGLVVSPEAWIFHKGLTFPKRTSKGKQLKDLYGIWYVISQLGSFSNQSIVELKNLLQKQPQG